MNENPIISISAPPLPIFIEGNLTTFKPGTLHPNRKNLQYFNIIFVKEGSLYLTEEDNHYTVHQDETLILLPNKHHYATKPVDKKTQFYWIHFYTTGNFSESSTPKQLDSNITIPSLHFHNQFHTIHFKKKAKLIDTWEIYQKIEELLVATTKEDTSIHFWDTQQRFFSLINLLVAQNDAKDAGILIAEKIEQFLREHFNEEITNHTLVERFNLHENTITKYLKEYYGYTPMEFLKEYRLDYARNLLLKTDYPIQEIAEECGFKYAAYFSRAFKNKFNYAPLPYRNKHIGQYNQ